MATRQNATSLKVIGIISGILMTLIIGLMAVSRLWGSQEVTLKALSVTVEQHEEKLYDHSLLLREFRTDQKHIVEAVGRIETKLDKISE